MVSLYFPGLLPESNLTIGNLSLSQHTEDMTELSSMNYRAVDRFTKLRIKQYFCEMWPPTKYMESLSRAKITYNLSDCPCEGSKQLPIMLLRTQPHWKHKTKAIYKIIELQAL